MDIRQAKEELRRMVLAYTERTEDGQLRIPMLHQRPALLMGPPGVGKTAILSQLADELHIGLVAYTMTHHTRQSALGLPLIREKQYGGKTCSATEYTMSEILASIYDQMEQTGQKTGFLFLDEINCVSETLMPAMLQMLQCKTFGVHALPEGWVIAAAGNPPRYNQSARSFDMATLDRVRELQIEPDVEVWQDYAQSRGVHPAILSYLRLHPEHFFCCDARAAAGNFVTGRGWEDLSALLLSYESLGFACSQLQMQEYLHVPDIAAAFAAYYDLFTKYAAQLPLEKILRGEYGAEAEPLRAMAFEGRLAVVEFLLHSLSGQVRAVRQSAALAFSAESFRASVPAADCLTQAKTRLEQRRTALRIRREGGVLPPEEAQREHAFLAQVDTLLAAVQTDVQAADALQRFAADNRRMADDLRQQTCAALENSLRFIRQTFGEEQELWILLSGFKSMGADQLLHTAGSELYAEIQSEATPQAKAEALRRTLQNS